MLSSAVSEFFKHKAVYSVLILSCSWSAKDRVQFTRQISKHGISASFSCNPEILIKIPNHRLQGVIYMEAYDTKSTLKKVKPEYFSGWYKWLIIGDKVPDLLHRIRYDADIAFLSNDSNGNCCCRPFSGVCPFVRLLQNPWVETGVVQFFLKTTKKRSIPNLHLVIHTLDSNSSNQTLLFNDVYIHPNEGATLHAWAYWTMSTGLQLTHSRERTLRRLDLKKYQLRIAAPVGYYTRDWYNGTFTQYLQDETMPERDSGVRSGFGAASLILETLNATDILIDTQVWSAMDHNSSMLPMVASDLAQLTGAILRILLGRIEILDYVMPIWPFRVGFTYLAERESSSNMYIEPFSTGVWWTCLGVGVLLAIAQRVTARKPEEKEGAYIGVLATWLQQDASAVPEGASGRWSFIVLSVSSMLVHAYYTSAIVSALMSTGRSGPESLRALGDSKYAIASEDYDYMRYLFFDVETNWDDMEYLKKKKMTSKFYQNLEQGVELIREGNTAYHTEYNQLYPHLRRFGDDNICKLQHVDTIPETLTWIATTKRSQWTDVLRSTGAWIHETGLAKRLVSHIKIQPPPCRSALLAERVNFADVAPLLGLTILGAVIAFTILMLEIVYDQLKEKTKHQSAARKTSLISHNIIEYIE